MSIGNQEKLHIKKVSKISKTVPDYSKADSQQYAIL